MIDISRLKLNDKYYKFNEKFVNDGKLKLTREKTNELLSDILENATKDYLIELISELLTNKQKEEEIENNIINSYNNVYEAFALNEIIIDK